jgi:coenzyme F420-reducing hydrogenase alpha subunit
MINADIEQNINLEMNGNNMHSPINPTHLDAEEKTSILYLLSQNKELMELIVSQNQEHRNETDDLIDQNKKMQRTIMELVNDNKIEALYNKEVSMRNLAGSRITAFEEYKDVYSDKLESIKKKVMKRVRTHIPGIQRNLPIYPAESSV